jgi:SAM-dependent methyltransferase
MDAPETEPNEWDADRYEGAHSFVYEYGEDVVDLLAPAPGERVLDVGCGTGRLTAQIARSGADVVGLDASGRMLSEATEARPGGAFVRGDARELPFEGAFDAVFSNAALHWITAQDAALGSIADALAPGGRLVAELGGRGNVAAIVEAVRQAARARGYAVEMPWYFPSVDEYASKLAANGLETRYARLFDRPTELDNGEDGLAEWLAMFGDGLLSDVPEAERPAVIEGVEDRLRDEHFDGAWTADYRRLRVVAVKPEGA